MSDPRFQRLGETERPKIRILIDGMAHTALAGDSLMTAILTASGRLRVSEFGDGQRAGFCVMGACQDCWVLLADGRRVRACTTPAADGMAVLIDREPGDV